MAIDINTVIENLNELLTNSVNLTDKYYDLFINPEPMMIDLELYNEDNQLVIVTVPNRAMDRENFGQLIEKVDALAEVASTGEYTDLKNVPDGTLTIQGNGTTVATFNNNSNTDVTANIQYPTRTSQLVNDAGFITNVTIPAIIQLNIIFGTINIQKLINAVCFTRSNTSMYEFPLTSPVA